MTRLRLVAPPALTRGECREWVSPCELTACRHNLKPTIHSGPARELPVSVIDKYRACVLNVADDGPLTQREVASVMGVSHQAINLTVHSGLRRMARYGRAKRLADDVELVVRLGRHT